ncbi:MAG: hypothetical protein PVF37_11130, partial [Desulfobacterales bacterium]
MSEKAAGGKAGLLISITAVAMAVFHLYTAGFGRFPALQQRSIHLAFALILTFYLYPVRKKGGSGIWA